MTAYIIRRILMIFPVILGITFLVFAISKITPGDPARQMLGVQATEERIEDLRDQLGLNDPVIVQYGNLLWDIFHGNLGVSYRGQKSVLDSILTRFPSTLELAVFSFVLSICTGIPAGMLAASKQGGVIDRIIQFLATLMLSLPVFWIAILFLYIFGVWLDLVSVSNAEGVSGLILPGVCMSIGATAMLARLTRASILDVLSEDYVRTARSKGLKERLVMMRHVLRNAFIPVITYLGMIFARFLTGAVFIESVFARSGLGRFMVNALQARDYPEVQGSVIFTAILFMGFNLVIDLMYVVIDPRIRYT